MQRVPVAVLVGHPERQPAVSVSGRPHPVGGCRTNPWTRSGAVRNSNGRLASAIRVSTEGGVRVVRVQLAGDSNTAGPLCDSLGRRAGATSRWGIVVRHAALDAAGGGVAMISLLGRGLSLDPPIVGPLWRGPVEAVVLEPVEAVV